MKKVAVSIHATENFKVDILKGLEGYDYIHVDVMDGKFVNNMNNNLNVFKNLKETYEIPIIAHLMVINPFDYIKKIFKFIDIFLFHFEVDSDKLNIIEEVINKGRKVGIAINPETDVSEIKPYLEKLDLVLVMSVNPGWSNQRFIPRTIKKVDRLAKYKKKYNFLIDVDGGINPTNAKLLKNADILSSASSILQSTDPDKVIELLKESDENS
ncbi:MAG: ribulose-phosphate 3-epimerase [Promethearchaeota archaeon]